MIDFEEYCEANAIKRQTAGRPEFMSKKEAYARYGITESNIDSYPYFSLASINVLKQKYSQELNVEQELEQEIAKEDFEWVVSNLKQYGNCYVGEMSDKLNEALLKSGLEFKVRQAKIGGIVIESFRQDNR